MFAWAGIFVCSFRVFICFDCFVCLLCIFLFFVCFDCVFVCTFVRFCFSSFVCLYDTPVRFLVCLLFCLFIRFTYSVCSLFVFSVCSSVCLRSCLLLLSVSCSNSVVKHRPRRRPRACGSIEELRGEGGFGLIITTVVLARFSFKLVQEVCPPFQLKTRPESQSNHIPNRSYKTKSEIRARPMPGQRYQGIPSFFFLYISCKWRSSLTHLNPKSSEYRSFFA